jgi:hypothetical protein
MALTASPRGETGRDRHRGELALVVDHGMLLDEGDVEGPPIWVAAYSIAALGRPMPFN